MDITFLPRGLVIGFLIAVPVGPIGLLCLRRTLAEGRVCGLVSGLGAATADAIYGCVAAFGVTFISDFLVGQQAWLRAGGGAFLCCLGIKTVLTKPAKQKSTTNRNGLVSAYASTFLLTLANPVTIFAFAAVFAGLGFVGTDGNYLSAGVLVLGVFTGSTLWWIVLSGGASLFRGMLNPRGLWCVNRISGAIITGFGVFALLKAL